MNLTRTKSIEQSIADTEESEHQLRKELGPLQLTVFGVGVVIGTGIFVLTGEAAGEKAGPAIAISFVFSGLACALAALCYAEFASTVPVAGSAYTFSYASLGELVAWIIGWDLILELALGASTVAVGWSTYFADVMKQAGITIPEFAYGEGHNLVAAAIVLILTAVICFGIKVSSQVNFVFVAIKVAIVLLVIIAGLFFVNTQNWSPFIPPAGSKGASGGTAVPSLLQDLGFSPGAFGISGIFTGAALVFFAYIGFDIVATAAEETKKPQRDMPIGIFSSLAICTTLYIAVSLVVTGMVKYDQIKVDAPLAEAFRSVGHPGFATVISVGALLGLTTVMMILLLGQSRVFFAMSRDRLLPPVFARVSPRFGTPVRTSMFTGAAVALIATFVPLTELAELVNIGTLFAFVLVAIGVIVLRRTRPDLERAFRCPGVPVMPVLAALASLYLMLNLPTATWIRFLVWMAVGFAVYFLYSAKHSRLATDPNYAREAERSSSST
ncbi:amino acid permease [Nocardioides marmoribigeumensis]|uniref:APA family basic amino acid/polyamine antiporter n=1 Tax=Nocardioides marmoribigeumensis TaxID=433649 RepID=A0ABU2C0B0_9ACTN|nr:amino acid permease [Nocardioides marmoribigeumensis]MDR7364093.1 APA family basic amino acid/polyamine antiporter [Nocardioides marmoribigeumensis]